MRAQLALRMIQLSSVRFEASFRHVVHELRNPLHGIAAGVDYCLSGGLSQADMLAELGAIADGVRMMTRLTNDFMDLQVRCPCAFACCGCARVPECVDSSLRV